MGQLVGMRLEPSHAGHHPWIFSPGVHMPSGQKSIEKLAKQRFLVCSSIVHVTLSPYVPGAKPDQKVVGNEIQQYPKINEEQEKTMRVSCKLAEEV